MRTYSIGFAMALAFMFVDLATAGPVSAFTEDFAIDAAQWRDSTGASTLGWAPNGGPDGGAYVATSMNFVGTASNATPILFRAHDEFNSSLGAFVGDWVAGGVNTFSAYVHHDAPMALNFFVRFSGPENFPASAKVFVIPVAPNTWTELSMPLPDPTLVFEGPFSYGQVFSNIGHVQMGVSAQGIAGQDQTIHFGLDKVSIIPEPATLLLLGAGGLAVFQRGGFRRGGQ